MRPRARPFRRRRGCCGRPAHLMCTPLRCAIRKDSRSQSGQSAGMLSLRIVLTVDEVAAVGRERVLRVCRPSRLPAVVGSGTGASAAPVRPLRPPGAGGVGGLTTRARSWSSGRQRARCSRQTFSTSTQSFGYACWKRLYCARSGSTHVEASRGPTTALSSSGSTAFGTRRFTPAVASIRSNSERTRQRREPPAHTAPIRSSTNTAREGLLRANRRAPEPAGALDRAAPGERGQPAGLARTAVAPGFGDPDGLGGRRGGVALEVPVEVAHDARHRRGRGRGVAPAAPTVSTIPSRSRTRSTAFSAVSRVVRRRLRSATGCRSRRSLRRAGRFSRAR